MCGMRGSTSTGRIISRTFLRLLSTEAVQDLFRMAWTQEAAPRVVLMWNGSKGTFPSFICSDGTREIARGPASSVAESGAETAVAIHDAPERKIKGVAYGVV